MKSNVLQTAPLKGVLLYIKSSSHLGGRTTGVQYFLDYIYFYATFQSLTQLAYSAANTSLLHFPTIQHLMHHLGQAIPVKVVLNGLYFNAGQTQPPCTTLPFSTDVVSHQVQVLLSHSFVL